MKKRILSLVLTGALCLSLTAPALAAGLDNFGKVNTYTVGQFTDVPADSWFAPNVQAAYELDLMTGSSATTFNPNGNLTIAEALVLACRLHSTYMGDGETFAVDGGTWYQPYVDYAVKNSIITNGAYADYTATATRVQFAAILAAALPDEALPAINSVTSLPDLDANAAYAAAVLKLYNAGILTGSDAAGSFKPESTIQRSEVATIVTRMADKSLRKTFTLTAAPTEQQGRSPMRTQADLEGTWSAVYTDGSLYEYTFSGDHFTRVVKHEFDSLGYTSFQIYDGTYTMTSEPINGDENVRKLTLNTTYEQVDGNSKDGFKVTGNDTRTIEFTTNLLVPEDCFIWSGATFYCAEPVVKQEYETVLANFGGIKDPADAGYPMYAEFPSIPDFGAIYGLERIPAPDAEDVRLPAEMEEIFDAADAYTSDVTTYYYSAYDFQKRENSFFPPYLDIGFFYDYEDALEACGFEGKFLPNILGEKTFYYEGYGYLVSYTILHVDLSFATGHEDYTGDKIAIYIQPA
ncbi:S-layer homology domain-containing protein [Intestinimonas timonensis]|uniref:S-layer homology domain-containing protein n=1 Tax=Intestinimonas timonensis TaxID=1689270 RepID=UPI0024B21A68|nr:S-layer homology domain-containing protein [Intestinimonas timonensis]